MKEYLESKEMEVVDMWMEIFDDEYILKAYAKDIEASTAERVEKKTARDTAKKLIKKGKMSLEEIAECVSSLSLDELRQLKADIKFIVIGKVITYNLSVRVEIFYV